MNRYIILSLIVFFLLGYLFGLFFQAKFLTDYYNKECNEFICDYYPLACEGFFIADPYIEYNISSFGEFG